MPGIPGILLAQYKLHGKNHIGRDSFCKYLIAFSTAMLIHAFLPKHLIALTIP
ncbi:Uncharacterised protein [Legionella pneumophila]|nr:Uncharacterised protein [Legionella pneumophila]